MSNNDPRGSGDINLPRQIATWIPPSTIVTPDMYVANRAKIQDMREALVQYEQQNEVGLQNYTEQQRVLLQQIEAGREAERQLAQMISENPSNTPGAAYSHYHNAQTSSSISGSTQYNQQSMANPTVFQHYRPQHPNATYTREPSVQPQSPAYHNYQPRASGSHASPSSPYGSQQPWATNGSAETQPRASYSQGRPQEQFRQHQPPPAQSVPNTHSTGRTASAIPSPQSASHRQEIPSQHASQAQNAPRPTSSSTMRPQAGPAVVTQVHLFFKTLDGLPKEVLKEVTRLIVKQLERKLFPQGVPSTHYLRPISDTWPKHQKDNILRLAGQAAAQLDTLPIEIMHLTLRRLHHMASDTHQASATPGVPVPMQNVSPQQSAFNAPRRDQGSQQSPTGSVPSTSPSQIAPAPGMPTQLQAMNGSAQNPILLDQPAVMINGNGQPFAVQGQDGVSSVATTPIARSNPAVQRLHVAEASTSSQTAPSHPNSATQIWATTPLPPASTSHSLSAGPSSERRTPAMADRSRLARDIMRSLGGSKFSAKPPSQFSSSVSLAPGTPNIFDPKGKRKGSPEPDGYPEKHVKLDLPQMPASPVLPSPFAVLTDVTPDIPVNQPTAATPPSASVVTTAPPSFPISVDPPVAHAGVAPPQLPAGSPFLLDTPTIAVLQDTSVSPVDQADGDSPEDIKEEQVDQLVDDDVGIYQEIKTPGVIQLEEEAQDEAMRLVNMSAHPRELPLPPVDLDIPHAQDSSNLVPLATAPEPPSSHTSVPPDEPSSDHFPNVSTPPRASHSASEIEHTLSRSMDHVPTGVYADAPEHLLQEFMPSAVQGSPVVSTPQSARRRMDSPDLPPLFLPSDDEEYSDDDVMLVRTPRQPSNAHHRLHTTDSDDRFVLDSTLLAGSELSSRALRSNSDQGSHAHVRPRTRGTRRMSYVGVPSLPSWAKKISARKTNPAGKRKARSASVVPGTPESDWDDPGELSVEKADEEEIKRNQEVEVRAAAELSYNRLRESRCRWQGCDAILISAGRLASHASTHSREKDVLRGFSCEWCLRRFLNQPSLAQHLRNHALFPLRCAYEDCDGTCANATELAKHHKLPRHAGDTLRPAATLITPKLAGASLPELGIVPAYLSVHLQVSPHQISRRLHQWLAPKVADNIRCLYRDRSITKIFGPSRGSRRLSDNIPMVEGTEDEPEALFNTRHRPPPDPYASWKTSRRRRGPKFCSDFPLDVADLLVSGYVVFTGQTEEEADAELLDTYREMDEADMDADVADEQENDASEIDIVGLDEKDSQAPDSRMEEEEDFRVDGPPSLSSPNIEGDGAANDGLDMSVDMPPASTSVGSMDSHHLDGDGSSGSADVDALQESSAGSAVSSTVIEDPTHQVDGDQETGPQVKEDSQPPAWVTATPLDDAK